MRGLVHLLLLSFGLNSFAEESPFLRGQIEDIFCGEIHPFAEDEGCVVLFTSANKKWGLHFEITDFTDRYPNWESFVGREVYAAGCTNIDDGDLIKVLIDYKKGPWYLSCKASQIQIQEDDI